MTGSLTELRESLFVWRTGFVFRDYQTFIRKLSRKCVDQSGKNRGVICFPVEPFSKCVGKVIHQEDYYTIESREDSVETQPQGEGIRR